ncbi:MAG TPA: nucleoside-diphosphate kinase [Anaerolineae bacterium]|nr:nucleoside-diphosphate kinase [Anaerolineae bacterium]
MHELFEKTLVLIKPDGLQRGLIGEIISRLEKRGLLLVAAKLIRIDKNFAEEHYKTHMNKPFFKGLVKYITSAPVMAMVWEGENSITAARQTAGATNPLEALPGTIRHDLALLSSRNLIHASDSSDTAEKEIALWFSQNEILSWETSNHLWIYGKN